MEFWHGRCFHKISEPWRKEPSRNAGIIPAVSRPKRTRNFSFVEQRRLRRRRQLLTRQKRRPRPPNFWLNLRSSWTARTARYAAGRIADPRMTYHPFKIPPFLESRVRNINSSFAILSMQRGSVAHDVFFYLALFDNYQMWCTIGCRFRTTIRSRNISILGYPPSGVSFLLKANYIAGRLRNWRFKNKIKLLLNTPM